MVANVATGTDDPTQPKQVVYLFGAGATHGEADFQGATINLLMNNHPLFGDGVSKRILDHIGAAGAHFSSVDHSVDIEKLISLLAGSGIDEHVQLAERLRRAYFAEVCASLRRARLIGESPLATGLLEMHSIDRFRNAIERLTGILTTNHDGLLQVASQQVFSAVDLGFSFASDHFNQRGADSLPPILQLHGSFTWDFSVPVTVSKLTAESEYSANKLWIPPTILKEAKNYPFNKVTGSAYELLAKHCDVLRIIGASLTQNDWNVLCLIFNAQRHKESVGETAFQIELILPPASCSEIERTCPYLRRVIPISQLKEGNMDVYLDDNLPPPDSEPMRNPFFYWLKEKMTYHLNRDGFDDGMLGATMRRILGDDRHETNGRELEN
jgi:hypothetical protein